MAKIIPFKAVRPVKDKVSLVTSRTYEDYTAAELASQLDFNPFSFLHILNPAYSSQQKISIENRFKSVAKKYHDFKAENILKQETKPTLFLYQIQSKNQIFTGIIAGVSVTDYQNNIIKKHEDTLPYRVALFKDYLHLTGFNTEPVLITYSDNTALNEWIIQKKHKRPLYKFSSLNKEIHTLCRINQDTEIAWLQKQFENINHLYIADGHHRSASAQLLYEQYKTSDNNNLNYFMGFLIAESNIKIYEYNRVIRDLNGLSKKKFLHQLEVDFEIENKEQVLWKPTKKFEFGMYFDGEFYALRLKEADCRFKTTLEQLDAQILYDKVLHNLLGINDLRNDERIEYISGKLPITKIKTLVDEDLFKVGFMLFPTELSEIKQIANENLIMPPKSTYIEPKLRNGLIIYEL